MAILVKYRSDREAIRGATQRARDAASELGKPASEHVLLRSGDTLIITSTVGGRVTRRTEAGWTRHGFVHAGPTAARVGVS